MDAILAYNDWSKEELKKRLGTLSNKVVGSAPPVANSSFTPKNRLALREQMGIGPHETIFGTVMRNQRRKLFPELFKGFRRYLDNGGDGRLICHTSFPDKGWDLQTLLKRNNLSNEVLFTYKCLSCDSFSLNSFKSLIKECPNCRKVSCKLCNVDDGLSTDQLSALYNVMDLYIQPCTNEGFGMPIVEAAACGTPVAVTNYSAPADIVQKLNGYPLEYTEFTNADDSLHKAIVSPEAISNLMMEFYKTPQEMRNKKRFETRQLFEKHYSSWKKTGQIWESVLDSLPYGRWNLPSCEKPINTTLPKLDSAYDISLYIIKDILKEKDMLYTLQHARLIRDLSFGFVKKTLGGEYDHETTSMQMQHEKLSPQELANAFANKRLLINNCERLRLS
jgi:glycosyltransferase involved in cell wall biosynthesis